MFSTLSLSGNDIRCDAATDRIQAFMRMVEEPVERGSVENWPWKNVLSIAIILYNRRIEPAGSLLPPGCRVRYLMFCLFGCCRSWERGSPARTILPTRLRRRRRPARLLPRKASYPVRHQG